MLVMAFCFVLLCFLFVVVVVADVLVQKLLSNTC